MNWQFARAAGRRPWWVWAAPFAVVVTVLCVRNRFLFTARLYEQGDSGANSILIEQARHFTLLVGNYSRERFNHPGPAFLYVEAAGESLFQNALHLVPTAWNGQMLAVYTLNGCFVALITGVAYGWTRSFPGAAACLAVLAGGAATCPAALSSNWMPYVYVPAYATLLVAAASVAAGAGRDLWIMVLAGWFLIHGHAAFLLLVPAIWGVVAVVVLWRHGPRATLWALSRPRRWVPATMISAVFALPIVLNLALHWPGDFGKYFSYGSSAQAGGHSLADALRYALRFWWPRGATIAWLAPLGGYAVAVAVTRWLAPTATRRFLVALLAVNVVSTVLFLGYAVVGVDHLTDYYIGYFYWSAPLVTVLVTVLGAVTALGELPGMAVAAAAAAAGVTGFAVAGGTTSSTYDIDPALPHAVASVAAFADGRMIVFDIGSWRAMVQVPGFLVQAERTGVRACVDDPAYTYVLTRRFVCTAAEAAAGVRFSVGYDPVPRGVRPVARMGPAFVASAAPVGHLARQG